MESEASSPHSQTPAICPYPLSDQTKSPHPLEIHFNITRPSTPRSSKWPLYSTFPHQNPAYVSLLSPIRATCPANLILLDFITRTILGEQYRSLSFSLCCFLHSRNLVPLRPKYSPQHRILKHPQPTFLPQCERPSFTPIQNNRQHDSSVYLNLYIFG